MPYFGGILKRYREKEGLSQAELAERLGISRSSVSMYERNEREPDFEMEERIADLFGTDINTLRGRESVGKDTTTIHILGYVQAGIPTDMITEILDDEEIPAAMARCGEYFGLRIKGRSMEPTFFDGDNIIVKKQPCADSGDIVVVAVNGENATVKILKKTSAGVVLQPKNPDFDPLFFTDEEVKSIPVTILGKVVELRRKL